MVNEKQNDNKTNIESKNSSSEVTKKSFWAKYGLVVFAAVLVLLLSIGYYFKNIFIAATVNGHPVSRLKIVSALEKQYGKQTLDSYVTESIILQEGAKNKVQVSNQDIDAEVKKIRDSFTAAGQNLDEYLSQAKMPYSQFYEQVRMQKILEKLLGDKISVSDQEIDDYIQKNKALLPADSKPEDLKAYVKNELSQQKFGTEFQKWLTEAKARNSVNYFVNY